MLACDGMAAWMILQLWRFFNAVEILFSEEKSFDICIWKLSRSSYIPCPTDTRFVLALLFIRGDWGEEPSIEVSIRISSKRLLSRSYIFSFKLFKWFNEARVFYGEECFLMEFELVELEGLAAVFNTWGIVEFIRFPEILSVDVTKKELRFWLIFYGLSFLKYDGSIFSGLLLTFPRLVVLEGDDSLANMILYLLDFSLYSSSSSMIGEHF